jgi:hypothetical protein
MEYVRREKFDPICFVLDLITKVLIVLISIGLLSVFLGLVIYMFTEFNIHVENIINIRDIES